MISPSLVLEIMGKADAECKAKVAAAVKAERERCAQLCEEYASRRGSPVGWLIDLASDIREGI